MNKTFELTGTMHSIGQVKELESGAKTLTFVIDTGDQYNPFFQFEMYKGAEYVKFIDSFESDNPVGSEVTVEFNIKSRQYEGRYYTNLSCWKVTAKAETNVLPASEVDLF